jgi:hypothetical protein
MLAKLVNLGKKDLMGNFFRNREKIADFSHIMYAIFFVDKQSM